MNRPRHRIAWIGVAFAAATILVIVWLVRLESDTTTVSPDPVATSSAPETTVPTTTVPTSTAPSTTTTGQATTESTIVDTVTRDPVLWPYPWDSIWNMPLGDQADLVPFNMVIPTDRTLNIEEDIIITAPDSPGSDIVKHDAAWRDGVTRCGSRTTKVVATDIPIPDGWFTDPGYTGRKPNHSAAILMGDMTLFETQPFHICEDGVAVSQFTNDSWQGDSILTGGMGDPDGGSHGGSFMTAFGGTIRLGEWVPGGEIRHVLKIDVYSHENLSPLDGGFRWPALRADRAYDNPDYGYGGTVPEAKMGALLALPLDFDVTSLKSEAAAIIALTLKRFGAYVVDGTGWSTAAFAVEWGPNGRVKDEFVEAWGFPIVGDKDSASGAQREFLEDLERIYARLHVVNDNEPFTTGGAGDRLAPWAPPFPDGTGGHP